MIKYLIEYIKAFLASISYMKGLRNVRFWLILPYKAHWIARQVLKDNL